MRLHILSRNQLQALVNHSSFWSFRNQPVGKPRGEAGSDWVRVCVQVGGVLSTPSWYQTIYSPWSSCWQSRLSTFSLGLAPCQHLLSQQWWDLAVQNRHSDLYQAQGLGLPPSGQGFVYVHDFKDAKDVSMSPKFGRECRRNLQHSSWSFNH